MFSTTTRLLVAETFSSPPFPYPRVGSVIIPATKITELAAEMVVLICLTTTRQFLVTAMQLLIMLSANGDTMAMEPSLGSVPCLAPLGYGPVAPDTEHTIADRVRLLSCQQTHVRSRTSVRGRVFVETAALRVGGVIPEAVGSYKGACT